VASRYWLFGGACVTGFSVLLIYYAVLTQTTLLNDLYEGERLLYALLCTAVMGLLGTLIGLTWDLAGRARGGGAGRGGEGEGHRPR